jgi:fused signal recognition particle receptor
MGLFAYLKNKFAGKKDEKEEAKTEKYSEGLSKSRAAFADRLQELSKRYKEVNESYFEELEQILIEADVGVPLTLKLVETLLELRARPKESKSRIKSMNCWLMRCLFRYVEGGGNIKNEVQFVNPGPTVLLVEGVNGVGKTTSIAKLAYRYQKQGKSVLLVASDTFRAGAVEQLQVWAERLHCPIVKGAPNGDPAAVAYDGAKYAKEHGIDLMIVDTAGRLQTKSNLMAELGKIKRVISKEIPNAPHETFLIIDATTGQNGVTQAEAFKEVSDVTGIVITKMDGTSKGGIILSIRDELGVPVRFIGLGEKMDDLEEFDLDQYLHGLLLGDKA